jgi:glycosyltransferase involved in cell wall biosynthesis
MATVANGLVARGHAVAFAYDPRGPVGERLGPEVRAAPAPIHNDVDPAALFRLRRLIRRHAAEVVCVNTFRELKVGGLAARLAGRARVLNRMGSAGALYNGARERLIYRALLDVLVRDSEWGCGRVRRENPWFRGPVLRARNGVDVAALAALEQAPRSALGAAPGEVLVAATVRKGTAHRAPELAAGARATAARLEGLPGGPPLRLVIIGETGPEVEAEVRRVLADSAGRIAVSFLGTRSPTDALRLLAACDLLARPSLSDGLSFAVLEAMALALPVVATAAGGLPEAVLDGETGLLVPPGDSAAMGQALASLAADPALRRRMGEAGRRRVEREFTESRMLDEYEEAFRQACGRL